MQTCICTGVRNVQETATETNEDKIIKYFSLFLEWIYIYFLFQIFIWIVTLFINTSYRNRDGSLDPILPLTSCGKNGVSTSNKSSKCSTSCASSTSDYVMFQVVCIVAFMTLLSRFEIYCINMLAKEKICEISIYARTEVEK